MLSLVQVLLSGVATGCVYGLVALSFVLIYKATETVSFAQGELMMLGAYAVWTLTIGADLSPWLAIPLAFVCAIVYGWLIERLFFERLVGESVFSMVMVTIGLVILIRGIVLVVWGAADRQFPVLTQQVQHRRRVIGRAVVDRQPDHARVGRQAPQHRTEPRRPE